MSSQNTSDDWIGKLVWIFLRDEMGLPISRGAEFGMVVDCEISTNGTLYVVQVEDNYYKVWEGDFEPVEDWDENVEREDG